MISLYESLIREDYQSPKIKDMVWRGEQRMIRKDDYIMNIYALSKITDGDVEDVAPDEALQRARKRVDGDTLFFWCNGHNGLLAVSSNTSVLWYNKDIYGYKHNTRIKVSKLSEDSETVAVVKDATRFGTSLLRAERKRAKENTEALEAFKTSVDNEQHQQQVLATRLSRRADLAGWYHQAADTYQQCVSEVYEILHVVVKNPANNDILYMVIKKLRSLQSSMEEFTKNVSNLDTHGAQKESEYIRQQCTSLQQDIQSITPELC